MDNQNGAKSAPYFNGNDAAMVENLVAAIVRETAGFRAVDILSALACVMGTELVAFPESEVVSILGRVVLLVGNVRRVAEANEPTRVAEMRAYQAGCAS